MIKILIVIDNLNKGGAQQQLLEFIKRYDKTKFKITLCSLDENATLMLPDFKAQGIEVKIIKQFGKIDIYALINLYILIKKEQFDIVHTYLSAADYYCRLAAILAGGVKIVTSVRGEDLWKRWQHIIADRILHRVTDRIIVNANRLKDLVVLRDGASPSKIMTIYNGIDFIDKIETITFGDNSCLLVGMVGRLGPEKDYPTFLKAAKEVTGEIKNVKFIIVGDGELKQELKNLAQELGISDKVIFTGLRKDILEVINSFDVAVLTSLYEGCPNVIMEAMALKKPVVATDVGGCAELVSDEITGYITKPKDYHAIADKIICLLKDKELRIRMGEAGFIKMRDNFDSKLMVSKIEGLYEELAGIRVGFIMPQFPRYDETFILREILELENQGLNMLIFSLKTPNDKIVHKESEKFINTVVNRPFFFSIDILIANLYFLITHPIKYIGSLFFILSRYFKSPNYLLKALAVFPKTVCYAKIAKKNNVKHVHGYWATTPTVSAMVMSRLLDIPFSFTGHAHDIYVDTVGLAEKTKKAEFVLTCTANNKKHLLGLVKDPRLDEKIIVSYHGVDLEKFKAGRPHSGTVPVLKILSVGSLLPCKGFDILIESCKILRDKGIDFECTIAGGGVLEANLKSQVAGLKLEDKIKFTGYITQDKLIPLYKQSDVFVLAMVPEIHWGIPNVLLEAMAARVPVICTMLPSIPELVEEGKTGFIVPAKDPKAIAAIIEKLRNDESLRKQVGEAGLKIVQEKFDVKKNAVNIKKVFEKKLEIKRCVNCNALNSETLIEGCILRLNHDILACKNCGLIFIEGANNGADYKKISSSYWNDQEQNNIYVEEKISDDFSKEFNSRITRIDSLLPNRGNLLDVGCGIGQFMEVAQKDGWKCSGLDVSPEAVSYVKTKLGVEAVCEPLKSNRLPNEYFDAITMWDVIEHLENPVDDLRIIHEKLKKGGILALKTPNESSLFKTMAKFIYKASFGRINFHLKYMYYSPHYYYFTPKVMRSILKNTGFEVVDIGFDETNLSFAQAKIRKHYGKFRSSRIAPVLLSPLFALARLLRMQNKMVVYARKI